MFDHASTEAVADALHAAPELGAQIVLHVGSLGAPSGPWSSTLRLDPCLRSGTSPHVAAFDRRDGAFERLGVLDDRRQRIATVSDQLAGNRRFTAATHPVRRRPCD